MDEVLAEAIQSLPEAPDSELDRINLLWGLAVGEEIGSRSRVMKAAKNTLFVGVKGQEWVPVIRSYERNILGKLNKMIDFKGFMEIIVKQVDDIPVNSSKPLNISEPLRRNEPMDKPNVAHEEHLKPIADPELRERLSRLSRKLRFVSLAWLSVLVLANCATAPTSSHSQAKAVQVDVSDELPSMTLGSSKKSYAVQQIRDLKKKYPDRNYRDPRAYFHYLKAYKYEREGDFDEAARRYALVVQFDPTREDLHTHLVSLYLRTGQFEQALDAGKNAISRFPNNVRVRMIMGDILSSQGKYQEALNHYQKVMDIKPANARAYLLAGYNLRALKKYEDARELFQRATVVEPANPLGYHYLGSALARTGEMESAEEKFKKSLTLRPSFIEARENLARVLELQKKYPEAMEQYKIILKLKPDDKKINEHIKRFSFLDGTQSNVTVPEMPPFLSNPVRPTSIPRSASFFMSRRYISKR